MFLQVWNGAGFKIGVRLASGLGSGSEGSGAIVQRKGKQEIHARHVGAGVGDFQKDDRPTRRLARAADAVPKKNPRSDMGRTLFAVDDESACGVVLQRIGGDEVLGHSVRNFFGKCLLQG